MPLSRLVLWLAIVLLAAQWPAEALALSGEVTHLSGAVLARRADGQTRILTVRSTVDEGDILATADNSFARVRFPDGTDLVMRPNSQIRIDAYKYEEAAPERDNVIFSLIKGGLRTVTGLLAKRNPNKYRLATPTATVGIRGTLFGTQFCNDDCAGLQTPSGRPLENGLHVDVSDGAIIISTNAGSQEFRIGEFGYVANINVLPVHIPPEQGFRVQAPALALGQVVAAGAGIGRANDLECAVR
ncbi:MAG: hypothetical protein A3G81_08320 [Betaproteobacteria bacterium RIFCSPLOWO2_12_FULL_65_14]|nr:MAG: hypothetical protein A3G81_08320 [Betaproteobacteria bacterium RIFCSPLOWO2_12_FULL_65_14]